MDVVFCAWGLLRFCCKIPFHFFKYFSYMIVQKSPSFAYCLNIWETVVIVLIHFSAYSSICISSALVLVGWLFFLFWAVFLVLCMLDNLIGYYMLLIFSYFCWLFLYFYKYYWIWFWNTARLLRFRFISCFYDLVGKSKVVLNLWFIILYWNRLPNIYTPCPMSIFHFYCWKMALFLTIYEC